MHKDSWLNHQKQAKIAQRSHKGGFAKEKSQCTPSPRTKVKPRQSMNATSTPKSLSLHDDSRRFSRSHRAKSHRNGLRRPYTKDHQYRRASGSQRESLLHSTRKQHLRCTLKEHKKDTGCQKRKYSKPLEAWHAYPGKCLSQNSQAYHLGHN